MQHFGSSLIVPCWNFFRSCPFLDLSKAQELHTDPCVNREMLTIILYSQLSLHRVSLSCCKYPKIKICCEAFSKLNWMARPSKLALETACQAPALGEPHSQPHHLFDIAIWELSCRVRSSLKLPTCFGHRSSRTSIAWFQHHQLWFNTEKHQPQDTRPQASIWLRMQRPVGERGHPNQAWWICLRMPFFSDFSVLISCNCCFEAWCSWWTVSPFLPTCFQRKGDETCLQSPSPSMIFVVKQRPDSEFWVSQREFFSRPKLWRKPVTGQCLLHY